MQLSWTKVIRDRAQHATQLLQTKTKLMTIEKTLQPFQNFLSYLRNHLLALPRMRLVTVKGLTKAVHNLEHRRLGNGIISPYMGLVLVAVFSLIGNSANRTALAAPPSLLDTQMAVLPPETVSQVLTAIAPLTPELDPQPSLVAQILLANNQETYVSPPTLAAMSQAETLSKQVPIPYTVRQGDTMSSIATANSRTVATILGANNIKAADAGNIQPGTVLLIPQEDTSSSLDWLVADQQAKAAAQVQLLAALQKSQAQLLAQRSKQNIALAASTTTDQSTLGFDSSGTTSNFIKPIHYTAIARGVGHGHMGVDFDAPVGTSVVAAASGRVVEITHGWAGGFGNSILIDIGGGVTTRYAHLSQTQVSIGQVVSQGNQIALSGNTGNSTGPHLHFETRRNGLVINPFNIWN